MRNAFAPLCTLLPVATLCLFCGVASAQESIKPSLTGAAASAARREQNKLPNYNLKLGPMTMDLTGQVEVEFNDNVNLSENDRKSDIILRPELILHTNWQITQEQILKVDLGIGLARYLLGNGLNSTNLLVDPGSQVSFDVYVGDFRINFHDQISVLQNPIDEIDLSHVANFNRVENSAGVSVLWDLNDVKLFLDYDHFNFWSLNNSFKYLDHAEEQLSFSASFQVRDDVTTGFDASADYAHYSQSLQNDSFGFSVGPFVEWQISNYLKARVAGGYQEMSFDSNNNNGDNSDLNGYYWNITIANRLNRFWSHSLALGREARLGLFVNFDEFMYLRYDATYRMNSEITLNFDAFAEDADDSGDAFVSEHSRRYGAGVNFRYQLSRKAAMSLGYQYVRKDSDVTDRDYYQNRAILDINYDF